MYSFAPCRPAFTEPSIFYAPQSHGLTCNGLPAHISASCVMIDRAYYSILRFQHCRFVWNPRNFVIHAICSGWQSLRRSCCGIYPKSIPRNWAGLPEVFLILALQHSRILRRTVRVDIGHAGQVRRHSSKSRSSLPGGSCRLFLLASASASFRHALSIEAELVSEHRFSSLSPRAPSMLHSLVVSGGSLVYHDYVDECQRLACASVAAWRRFASAR